MGTISGQTGHAFAEFKVLFSLAVTGLQKSAPMLMNNAKTEGYRERRYTNFISIALRNPGVHPGEERSAANRLH
jgi:hypothetical protein